MEFNDLCFKYVEGTSLKQRIPVREYNLSERGLAATENLRVGSLPNRQVV